MGLKLGSTDIPAVRVTGGITPTGIINITENNIYDVTNYATANVNVSGGTIPTHTLTLDSSFQSSATALIWNTTDQMMEEVTDNATLTENALILVWIVGPITTDPHASYEYIGSYDFQGTGDLWDLYVVAMPNDDMILYAG